MAFGVGICSLSSVPTQRTYSGWTARGWGTGTTADAATTTNYSITAAEGTKNFYGLYQRFLSLSHNANGGTGAPGGQTGTQYTNSYSITTTKDPIITLSSTKPTRAKYMFAAWAKDSISGAQYQPGASLAISANTVMYAVWYDLSIDTDKDGLPDVWEIYGADINGDGIIDVPLNLMGANPNVPDIYVEIDWMAPGGGKTYQPTEASMKAVYEVFKAKGIRLHIDQGPESTDYVTGTKWKNYPGGSGANSFAYSAANQYPDNNSIWTAIINNNFTPSRRRIFHHSAFVANLGGYGGWGNVQGQHTLLLKQSELADSFCFMHEIGHNLGLRHGGQDTVNYKPNYISIMNYSLSYNNKLGLNYSEQALPDLNEASLTEVNGVDPSGLFTGRGYESFFVRNGIKVSIPSISRTAVDWNGNGRSTDTGVRMDINNDGGIAVLKGFKDWDKLIFKGGNVGTVGAGGIEDDIYSSTYFDQFEMPEEVTIEELIDLGFYFPEDVPSYTLTLNANGGSVTPTSYTNPSLKRLQY